MLLTKQVWVLEPSAPESLLEIPHKCALCELGGARSLICVGSGTYFQSMEIWKTS